MSITMTHFSSLMSAERTDPPTTLMTETILFQLSFTEAAIGMVHCALDGSWIRVNRQACQLFGYTESALLDSSRRKRIYPDGELVDLATLTALQQEQCKTSVIRRRCFRHDGEIIWVKLSLSMLRGDDGAPLCCLAIIEDISDVVSSEQAVHNVKRGQQDLLFEKQQIETILNHTPNAKFLLDQHLQIQRINEVVRTLFRCPEREMCNGSMLSLVADVDRQQLTSLTVDASETSQVHNSEVMALRCDGTTFPAEVNIVNIGVGYVCTLKDITERKENEETLMFHASLQEHVSDAVIAKDSSMRIRSWNRAAEAMYGWRAEEVIGRPIHDVIQTLQTPEEEENNLRMVYEQGVWHGEVIQQRKDGTPIHVLRSVTMLKNQQGEPTGFVTVNHDMTDYRQIMEREKELTALKAHMSHMAREQELTELKKRLIYMASHEFRTPLSTIHSLTDTLSAYRERMNEQQIESRLEKIRNQTIYLSSMVEDVLSLATIEAKQTEFAPTLVDLCVLCRSIIDEMQLNASYHQTIAFECTTADEAIGMKPIRADAKLLRQMITNLLSNAAKYSPDSSTIQVSIQFDREQIALCIRDDGVGISVADQARLFDPFHRGQNVDTIRGTGLGLTIVKEIVELHDGKIEVVSEIDNGSEFIVTLPW